MAFGHRSWIYCMTFWPPGEVMNSWPSDQRSWNKSEISWPSDQRSWNKSEISWPSDQKSCKKLEISWPSDQKSCNIWNYFMTCDQKPCNIWNYFMTCDQKSWFKPMNSWLLIDQWNHSWPLKWPMNSWPLIGQLTFVERWMCFDGVISS